MEFKIKAGRFVFDKDTKKVKISKQKGLIHVLRNQEQQTHFKWANLDTMFEQFDIIVFPGDAIFQPVINQKNTFVLRFGMDEDRYFFWLQEKADVDLVLKEINRLINYQQPEPEYVDSRMQQQPSPKQEQKIQQPIPQQRPNQSRGQQPPNPKAQQDFIAKIAQGLAAASKKQQHREQATALTHLSDAVTPDVLITALKELNEEQIQKFAQFLPEQHQNPKTLPSTFRSPQFLQALDVLSDALNSENVLPLFMELGLNQQFLKKHYGVQAFLLALIQKHRKKG